VTHDVAHDAILRRVPQRIQAVERAAALLRAVADAAPGEISATNLATSCGLNRATAWRLLATLEDNGLVERRRRGYTLGVVLAQMSSTAARDTLARIAHPVLDRLASVSGDTASLAVARRSGLYYVSMISGSGVPSEPWLGRHVPLHATSSGKAYCSRLDPDEVDELLPPRLPAFTTSTIVDHDALHQELAATRLRGYAVCAGELDPQFWGVAAPVLDLHGRPLGSIDIWGGAQRVTLERFGVLGELVRDAAAEVAAGLARE
jgi:DNA-binding IclR family transcriptional regulator